MTDGIRRRFVPAALALAVPALAVAFAAANANPIAAFPSITLKVGNGVSQFHVPLLGFVLTMLLATVSAKRSRLRAVPLAAWAELTFGATHLLALLAFQWRQGLYDVVLGSPLTPRIYLFMGNVYVVVLLAMTTVGSAWAMTSLASDDGFVARFATSASRVVDARTVLLGSLVGLPLVSVSALASPGLWPLAAILLATGGGIWLNRGRRWRLLEDIKGILRTEIVLVVGLIVLSFAVRYYWGRHLLTATGPDFLRASDDGLSYDVLARQIAAGVAPPLKEASYWGGMLYWYFLGLLYRIWGAGNFVAAILVQSALGAIVPVATYLIGRDVLNSKSLAMTAGAICALNVTLIYVSGVIGMEALFVPLVCLGLVLLTRSWANDRASTGGFLAAGLFFGLANMARNELLGYPLVLLMVAAAFAVRRYRTAGDVRVATHEVRMVGVLCLGFFVVWMAQAFLNHALYGHFTLPSAQARETFARGTFGIEENAVLDSMGFNPFRDAVRSLGVFAAQPQRVVWLLASGFVKRFYTFLLLPNAGIFDPLTLTISGRINDVLPATSVNVSSVIEAYEILFGVAGVLAFLIRGGRRMVTASLLALLGYSCVLNAFIDAKSARHRAILIPVLTLCLMKGVEVVLQAFQPAPRFELESLPGREA